MICLPAYLMNRAKASPDDETYEYAITIARLERELTEIEKSVSPHRALRLLISSCVGVRLWSRSSPRIAMPSSRRRRRSRSSSTPSTCISPILQRCVRYVLCELNSADGTSDDECCGQQDERCGQGASALNILQWVIFLHTDTLLVPLDAVNACCLSRSMEMPIYTDSPQLLLPVYRIRRPEHFHRSPRLHLEQHFWLLDRAYLRWRRCY